VSAQLRQLAGLRPLVYLTALAVAAFAFVVSYSHIYDLGRGHAQSGVAGRLLPLSVDLLIVAASLVLLIQSGGPRPETWLARWWPRGVLWTGIGATVAANLAYGLPHGWLAAVISAWPGAAFVGVVEMVMIAVRPGADRGPRLQVPGTVPSSVLEAAEAWFAATVRVGNPASLNKLQERFPLTRAQATEIRTAVLPPPVLPDPGHTLNGDGPH
jgi:hypothetical protein